MKKEKGFSVIPLVIAILLLGSIGYIISSLMTRSQETVPRTIDSVRSFYVAQGGLEYVGKYLEVSGGSDWTTTPVPPNQPIVLGNGNFTVSFSPTGADDLTATIIGHAGSAQRRVVASFHKTGGGNAIQSQGGISMGNNAWIDCEPANPANTLCNNSNLGSCACTDSNVAPADMPTIAVPGGLNAPPIGCSFGNNFVGTIPAGTYRCASGMTLGNNAVISLGGPVTLFTTTLTLSNNATFNSAGSAADLLIIASGNVTFNSNSAYKGALYAPGRRIRVQNNAMITGTLAGGESGNSTTISINNNAGVTYDSTAGSSSSYYNQIGGGGGGVTVSQTDWQE